MMYAASALRETVQELMPKSLTKNVGTCAVMVTFILRESSWFGPATTPVA